MTPDLRMPFWGWVVLAVMGAMLLLPIVLGLYIRWWDAVQWRLFDLFSRT